MSSGDGASRVGDQVAQVGVAVVADRGVQRHGVLRPADELADPLHRHAHRRRDLLRLGVGAELAGELAGHVAHPVDVLDQVHRQPHGALLLGDGPADRLTDPPRRVGRELVAAQVVELLHRADQAGVALLDQVEHRHAGPHVTPGDRDDQTQVGPDEPVLRLLALGDQSLQLLPARRRRAPRSCRAAARRRVRPRSPWPGRPPARHPAAASWRSRAGRRRRGRAPRRPRRSAVPSSLLHVATFRPWPAPRQYP